MNCLADSESLFFSHFVPVSDPNMVSSYMYPAGTNNAQTATQGQAVATTNPAYSSYQPTPNQGYQVSLPKSVSLVKGLDPNTVYANNVTIVVFF